jgi:hypothetical protein
LPASNHFRAVGPLLAVTENDATVATTALPAVIHTPVATSAPIVVDAFIVVTTFRLRHRGSET